MFKIDDVKKCHNLKAVSLVRTTSILNLIHNMYNIYIGISGQAVKALTSKT